MFCYYQSPSFSKLFWCQQSQSQANPLQSTSLVLACIANVQTHQDGTDEAYFKDRGSKIEDKRTQDKGDAPRATVNSLG